MLSEEKIILMTRLAEFEQGAGQIDLKRTNYYKTDYIRWQIIKTLLSVTGAVFLVLLLVALYNAEYLITNALELDFVNIGKYILVIYIGTSIFFVCLTIAISSIQYEQSKRRVKEYYANMNNLLEYYEEEENNSNKKEDMFP